MTGTSDPTHSTVTAHTIYTPLPGTPDLHVGVALTTLDVPLSEGIRPHASQAFPADASFPVTLTVFDGDPHPFRWAGHEVHSSHHHIRTDSLDVLAVAENGLDVPRHACRALPGLEDWAEEPPPGRLWGYPAGDARADVDRSGVLNGWTVHLQAPSRGTFKLTAPVVRRRADPTTQAPQQLGVITVSITLS